MKTIRIVNNDGISTNTKVYNHDGKEVSGIYRITLNLIVGEMVKANIGMYSTCDITMDTKNISTVVRELAEPFKKTIRKTCRVNWLHEFKDTFSFMFRPININAQKNYEDT